MILCSLGMVIGFDRLPKFRTDKGGHMLYGYLYAIDKYRTVR